MLLTSTITAAVVTSGAPTPTATFAGASTTTIDGIPSVTITSAVPFPTDLPTKIVPANVIANPVGNATSVISILFGNALPWAWLVANGNASAQIFAYTPATIADALGIPVDQVQTISLSAFQPSGFTGNQSTILTMYLAYIPTADVDALEAQLKSPNSALYQQAGVKGQIARIMISTFPVLAYSTSDPGVTTTTAVNATNATTTTSPDRTKTIIIAVFVSFGVVILAIAAYAALWATKRGAVALPASRNHERSSRRGERQEGHARVPSGLRSFTLGQGNPLTRSNTNSSTSSASTDSTGYSGSSRPGWSQASIEPNERRSSWWRFSASSAHGQPLPEIQSPYTPYGYHNNAAVGPEMREHRRINVVRGANGQFDSSVISQ